MRYLVSLVLAIFVFFVVSPSTTQALSVAYCEEDTVECKIQNCETDVLVNNWPTDTGYTRDCEAEYSNFGGGNNTVIVVVVTSLALVAWVGFLYVIRNIKTNKLPNRK